MFNNETVYHKMKKKSIAELTTSRLYYKNNKYNEFLLIKDEVSVYQIHIRALVMRAFNSLDNANRQFIWSYFIFKHVTINSKNGPMLKVTGKY